MRLPILLGVVVLLSRPALGQTPPDVAEILKKISETYGGVSQYELVAEVTLNLEGTETRTHTRIAFKAPNQYRFEGMIPGLDETVMIHDGATLWFYLPKSNQYLSIPADQLAPDNDQGRGNTPEQMDRVVMQKYRAAADFIKGAKFLREDEIQVGAANVACYVISVPEESPGPYTWWVDEKSHRVLREVTSEGGTTYTIIKLGEALPDGLFKFKPPPGARKLNGNAP
jgi:outer membrane lipoprotein-sorting protein